MQTKSVKCRSFIWGCMFVLTGYGVQKNMSNGGAVISSGASTGKSGKVKNFKAHMPTWLSLLLSATRFQTDDAYRRDYKYVASEKENVPARRDGEMLILAKDSGKQFTTTTGSSGVVGGGEWWTLLQRQGWRRHKKYYSEYIHSGASWILDISQTEFKQIFLNIALY